MTRTVKELLQEFVGFLEATTCSDGHDPACPFEMPVTPKTLAQLEVALTQAKATDEQVVLLTNGTTPQALIAGFVLMETGLTVERIVAGLSDSAVEALTKCFSQLKESKLLLLEASSIDLPKPEAAGVRYLMLSGLHA
jgi:hypothetical protein